MPTQEIEEAIAMLETQLEHYKKLMDQSIKNNEIFLKTKVIYQDLKAVAEKLSELKKYKKEK